MLLLRLIPVFSLSSNIQSLSFQKYLFDGKLATFFRKSCLCCKLAVSTPYNPNQTIDAAGQTECRIAFDIIRRPLSPAKNTVIWFAPYVLIPTIRWIFVSFGTSPNDAAIPVALLLSIDGKSQVGPGRNVRSINPLNQSVRHCRSTDAHVAQEQSCRTLFEDLTLMLAGVFIHHVGYMNTNVSHHCSNSTWLFTSGASEYEFFVVFVSSSLLSSKPK